MTIIKIEPNENGSHANQTINGTVPVTEGWAVVPDNVIVLENFPFGEATVEDIDGTPAVTGWTPLPMPESQPEPETEPTQLDRMEAQATWTALRTDTLLEV